MDDDRDDREIFCAVFESMGPKFLCLTAPNGQVALEMLEKKAIINNDTLPMIYGIPVQMSQLFGNLISNALKFSGDGKPIVHIRVSDIVNIDELKRRLLDTTRQYHHISFKDNGIGFNQNNAEQIFDIFQRLHSKEEYQGTGIGLAMCKKICGNHGGTIYAESTPGQGAIFHLILPMADA